MRIWGISLAMTIALMAGLWALVINELGANLHSDNAWVQWGINALNSIWFLSPAVLFGTLFLFPPVMVAVLMLFADRIMGAVESQYYPTAQPTNTPLMQSLKNSMLFTVKMLLYNMLALPLYIILLFIPPLSLMAYYTFNGWLLGQDYFNTVGNRYTGYNDVCNQWKNYRLKCTALGAVCVFGLTIPVLNLIVPIVGLIAMVHLWHDKTTPTQEKI